MGLVSTVVPLSLQTPLNIPLCLFFHLSIIPFFHHAQTRPVTVWCRALPVCPSVFPSKQTQKGADLSPLSHPPCTIYFFKPTRNPLLSSLRDNVGCVFFKSVLHSPLLSLRPLFSLTDTGSCPFECMTFFFREFLLLSPPLLLSQSSILQPSILSSERCLSLPPGSTVITVKNSNRSTVTDPEMPGVS